ncbi:MAG TPA: glycerophosphoryl diester phosphodiesterase membrane domain-containing protein [Candidatus Angelobacter sp.]
MATELTLRPMSTSQVLDRTFQLYRSHFVLLAGIGLLLPALLMILQLAFIPLGYPPRITVGVSPVALLGPLLSFLACYAVVYTVSYALAGGATVYGVAKLHLGETVTIGQAYKQVVARFWRVLGIIILVSLAAFGAIFVGEFIAAIIVGVLIGSSRVFAGSGAGVTIMAVIGIVFGVLVFLAGLLGGVFLYCKFCLAVPACILEKLPVGAAIARSWSLTKGTIWRLILVFLLTGILGVVLGVVLGLPGQIYQLATHGRSFLTGVLLQEVGAFFAGVLANPIATISLALIYYDQRVRHEAFDLQLMMQAIGQPPAQQAAGVAHGIR